MPEAHIYADGFDFTGIERLPRAESSMSKKDTLGFVMEKPGDEREQAKHFFDHVVPDELKWPFIRYAHEHLEGYARDERRDRR